MGRMILVVEDDPIQASNITAYLTRNGWEVQSCSTAEEALSLGESLHPDAVVTDQRLPRMSGIEMMQKMREADPLLKCIVMTGDDSAQTAVQAMKAGAYDYVLKPVVMAELHLLLERAIGRHGYDIYVEGAKAGIVTSGTQTPFLKKAIGMAYLPSDRTSRDATS